MAGRRIALLPLHRAVALALAASLSVPAVAGGPEVFVASFDGDEPDRPGPAKSKEKPHGKAKDPASPQTSAGGGHDRGSGGGKGGGDGGEQRGAKEHAPAAGEDHARSSEPQGSAAEKEERHHAEGGEDRERPSRHVEPKVERRSEGSVARADFHGAAGERVEVPLADAEPGFRALGLRIAREGPVAVEVRFADAPGPDAPPMPEGLQAQRHLDVHVAEGAVEGGSLAFALTAEQLQGHAPAQVAVLHGLGAAWEFLDTRFTAEGDGFAFEADTASFSPFAIVFDVSPPTVRRVEPEGAVAAAAAIAAALEDARGIDAARTLMAVDGQRVEAAWEQGQLVHRPPAMLAEGLHTVLVSAVDHSGLAALRTWSFTIVGSAAAAGEPLESASVEPSPAPRAAAPFPGALLALLALAAVALAARRQG